MKTVHIDSSVQMPKSPGPIFIVGAGAIVRDAHLPAYVKAGWTIAGITDPEQEKALQLSGQYGIKKVYGSIHEMAGAAPVNAAFDIAVPAGAITGVISQIPMGATIMIQKPMGNNIEEATEIFRICKEKKFVVAMNFQKRFIPAILAAKRIIDSGAIGKLHHIEIRMNIYTPWELWDFLFGLPRMEMLYHSIHYMDLMRYFLGDPGHVYAKTVKHPLMTRLASTRSVIILNYGDEIQAFINTNHNHVFGDKYQDAFIKWEGTEGAIRHTLGTNINFPHGAPDTFEVSMTEDKRGWISYPIEGKWYPDAFLGSMANLMCVAEGSQKELINSIDSAYKTMLVVEAAYQSSNQQGTPVNYDTL